MTRNIMELDTPLPDTAVPDIAKLFVDSTNDCGSTHEEESPISVPVYDENADTNNRFGDIDLSSVVSRDDLISLQQSDNSLSKLFHLVENEPYPSSRSFLFMKNGLLMRRQINSNHNITSEQIVVPACLRNKLLWLAHDMLASGHLAERKTKFRLMNHFWWPKCGKHVHEYVTSCDVCQRLGKSGKPKPAPLIPLPLISEPFQKVAIDIVGPLPTTAAGNRFILTLIDLGSLYPEAVALPSHTAADVATALSQVFSRFGFPEVLLSDQAPDFMSQLMQVFLHDFQISQIRCSVYHPQSNGTLERFHRTLKSMLRATVDKYAMDWDKSLHWSLFAFREIPVETIGFSPFEMLFGRKVRGPLHLMKSAWSNDLTDLTNAKPNVIDYMLDLRSTLQDCRETALENAKQARVKSKCWFNKKAVTRSFQPGDKVLVLLPAPGYPLQAKYQGPYKVISRVGEVDYWVEMPDKRKSSRLLHVNLLKRYIERDAKFTQCVTCDTFVSLPVEITDEVPVYIGQQGTSIADDFQLDHLTEQQRNELSELLSEFGVLFNDRPGRTTLTSHHIELKPGSRPIRQPPYRVNPQKADLIREELEKMKDMGVIEESFSPWASPIVLIPKPDGSVRFCIDYRKVNDLTIPDGHPMPRIDDLVDKIGASRFKTKIDLSRGYWQVPLDDDSVPISAFVTPHGQFQWRFMPFGLRNAPATFQRLVWKVLAGLEGFTCAYLDDVVIFSNSWSEHMNHLRIVFSRLQNAGLTLKKAKCVFATAVIDYLGHTISIDSIQPREAKVAALIQSPQPSNRKQLKSFLGLVGYYRKFIPHFAAIVSVLTNMLRKGEKFTWSKEADAAFVEIKSLLASKPILRPPDFRYPFFIGVDASSVAIGAYLFQMYDGLEHPVCYYSKRLTPAQTRYSTIEREALALVIAVRVFRVYFGTEPITVYTDNSPLQFMSKMSHYNDRLLRQCLELQQYNIVVVHRSGKSNVIPDVLSRPSV